MDALEHADEHYDEDDYDEEGELDQLLMEELVVEELYTEGRDIMHRILNDPALESLTAAMIATGSSHAASRALEQALAQVDGAWLARDADSPAGALANLIDRSKSGAGSR